MVTGSNNDCVGCTIQQSGHIFGDAGGRREMEDEARQEKENNGLKSRLFIQ